MANKEKYPIPENEDHEVKLEDEVNVYRNEYGDSIPDIITYEGL